MRPYYESQADRTRESEVIDLLCKQHGLHASKQKPSVIVDYALMDAEGICTYVCEVKVRNKSYPDMFISLAKVQALRSYAAIGIHARILFAMPEGVFVQKVGPLEVEGWITLGGRTDRGDKDDQELVVHYETKGMKRVFDSKKEWFA